MGARPATEAAPRIPVGPSLDRSCNGPDCQAFHLSCPVEKEKRERMSGWVEAGRGPFHVMAPRKATENGKFPFLQFQALRFPMEQNVLHGNNYREDKR